MKNQYIRMKKKTLLIVGMILMLFSFFVGYYIWCTYHPNVIIQISDGPTAKKDIKIEAPNIAITGKGMSEPAAIIVLKAQNITDQHEWFYEYISNMYKKADIKLEIKVKEKHTVMKYYGTVITNDDKLEHFEKEIICDYSIDAIIKN